MGPYSSKAPSRCGPSKIWPRLPAMLSAADWLHPDMWTPSATPCPLAVPEPSSSSDGQPTPSLTYGFCTDLLWGTSCLLQPCLSTIQSSSLWLLPLVIILFSSISQEVLELLTVVFIDCCSAEKCSLFFLPQNHTWQGSVFTVPCLWFET